MPTKVRSEATYMPSSEDQAAIDLVVKCTEECETQWHDTFATKVDRRYAAYRGLLDEQRDGWRANFHPPYLLNIIEGMMASMIDPWPMLDVAPFPIPGMTLDDVDDRMRNSELVKHLLEYQFYRDRFAEKQRPFMQQDLIASFTVAKQRWLREKKQSRYLAPGEEIVYDEFGGTIDVIHGLEEKSEEIVYRNDPTMEVRDVRDWMVHQSVTDLESAPFVVDRTLATMDTLRRMDSMGIYENVEYLTTTGTNVDIPSNREQALRQIDRSKGMVEVLEYWTKESVITIGNRTVLLRKAPNPFWHGAYPFVTTSAIPEMFQIPGTSVVEALAPLQDMLWTLQNSRLDALRVLTNVITVIRGDVDNPQDFEFAPLAQWTVEDPDQVKTLDIDPTPARITLEAEALLKGDISSLMGGMPFASGAQSQVIDQKTATGVSIVTSIAQAILSQRKQFYLWSYEKIAQQFLSLDQQFMRDSQVVFAPGEGDSLVAMEIFPGDIRGIFDVRMKMNAESLVRQERRAESQSLLTMALQGVGPSAQMGVVLNLRKYWEHLLESYNIMDVQSYFLSPPGSDPSAASVQAGGQVGSTGTPQSAEAIMAQMANGNGGGSTNAELAAGSMAPSNEGSMNASAAMQRSLARTGAGRSV